MAVYGNMLAFFPEQFLSVLVWQAKPKHGAGYDDATTPETVRGVLQNTGGDGFVQVGSNLDKSEGWEFWTRRGGLDGWFMKLDETSEEYRLRDNNRWNFEGGFFRYDVEQVQGIGSNNAEQVTISSGANFFG